MLRGGAVAVVATAVLAGCGDDTRPSTGTAEEPGGDPSVVTSQAPGGTADADCSEVVTDEVTTLLGWSGPGPATESAGRCRREGDGDLVTVGADPTVRPDAGGDDVQQAYETACESLEEAAGAVRERDPAWLDGVSACTLGPDDETASGFFEFYTISDSGWLVHGQLAQSTQAEADDVRSALSVLVERSVAADWG